MKTLTVVLHHPADEPLTRMAVAALKAEAPLRGLELAFSENPATHADTVLHVTGDPSVAAEPPHFLVCDRPAIIRHTGATLDPVAPRLRREATPSASLSKNEPPACDGTADAEDEPRFLVGVTSCPTGIAHTFMAAEALLKGAEAMGYTMKVETRGSVGAKNELTAEEIERADAVIVAADAAVETARFAGKKLLETGTKAAIKDARGLIRKSLELEPSASAAGGLKMPPKTERKGAYKHLMTGVSHMLPLVVAGGLLIALAFAIGGIDAADQEGTIGAALVKIGGSAAFSLFIPVLAGFISFSIADRPGLTPGLIGGFLAANLGAGFLGGLAAGFLAGYSTSWLNRSLKLPESLQGIKPVLLLPLISSLIVGLSMIYLIGPPVKVIMDSVSHWLQNMQGSSALILGLVLGGMMAFDMGGPINKSAYTFAVGLVATQIYGPMAAVMAAGMTPPLGVALAASLFRRRFSKDEQQATKATAILGISFITEGAIPYAAADPLRVIPATVLGSAVAGAISMGFGCQLLVPHGGIFVLTIPGAINPILGYLAAIVAGTLTTTGALYFLKKPVPAAALVPA